jgi:decaprenylphospho-beta-D-erythro-pentofuranosid-2-ulose 2-reductase
VSVLILGCTSPIARALAHAYAEAGYQKIAVAARDQKDAQDLASDLLIRWDIQTFAYAFDARDCDAHAYWIQQVEQEMGSIEVGILAFGSMGIQSHLQKNIQAAKAIMEVNYLGAVSLCERLAESMENRRAGSIITLSSVAGERGRKSNYIYGSAKGALSLYTQGLRNRLHSLGIQVLNVKLGFIDTPMTYAMNTPLPIAKPQAAARAILKAQHECKDEIYYPSFWKSIMGVIRALPEPIFKRTSL